MTQTGSRQRRFATARLAERLASVEGWRCVLGGLVGWWLVAFLLLCGPSSAFDEPYFDWDHVVRGIWSGCAIAAVAASLFSLPPIIIAILLHAWLRKRDRRHARMPRDSKPLRTFLMASWPLAVPLFVLAPISCISNGLNELMSLGGRPVQIPHWAELLRAPMLCYPLSLVVLATGCLTLASFLASLAAVTQSIRSTSTCSHCRYSRDGLPTHAPCPECGHITTLSRAVPVPPKPQLLRELATTTTSVVLPLITATYAASHCIYFGLPRWEELLEDSFKGAPELQFFETSLFITATVATWLVARCQPAASSARRTLGILWRLQLVALLPILVMQTADVMIQHSRFRWDWIGSLTVRELARTVNVVATPTIGFIAIVLWLACGVDRWAEEGSNLVTTPDDLTPGSPAEITSTENAPS